MAFVKLDCGILNSTLWIERECREVFITALLMAVPRELSEPVQTYQVRELEPAALVVAPGWYGLVEAAGPAIVRRALVPEDVGMAALERLCGPDPGSRSTDFEGRRLARVDGGFLVLNFMRYREKDATNADRCRRYRQNKKQRAGGTE